MSKIVIPEGYQPLLDIKATEIAIKRVKDFFQRELATQLNLRRVSAPLFVLPESGLNDNLNGVAVSYTHLDVYKRQIIRSVCR